MPKRKQRKRNSAKASPGLEFNHVMLYVRELAPALHFYVDLLGFKLIEQVPGNGFAGYARLRAPRGRSTLALHGLDAGRTLPETEGIRLYFEVKHLARVCKRLEAEGVNFLQAPKAMPWGWRHAYLRDPAGHELSLYWAGAKRFQKTPS